MCSEARRGAGQVHVSAGTSVRPQQAQVGWKCPLKKVSAAALVTDHLVTDVATDWAAGGSCRKNALPRIGTQPRALPGRMHSHLPRTTTTKFHFLHSTLHNHKFLRVTLT